MEEEAKIKEIIMSLSSERKVGILKWVKTELGRAEDDDLSEHHMTICNDPGICLLFHKKCHATSKLGLSLMVMNRITESVFVKGVKLLDCEKDPMPFNNETSEIELPADMVNSAPYTSFGFEIVDENILNERWQFNDDRRLMIRQKDGNVLVDMKINSLFDGMYSFRSSMMTIIKQK